jgi:hypothetical protein
MSINEEEKMVTVTTNQKMKEKKGKKGNGQK